jgi:hypothetical protein
MPIWARDVVAVLIRAPGRSRHASISRCGYRRRYSRSSARIHSECVDTPIPTRATASPAWSRTGGRALGASGCPAVRPDACPPPVSRRMATSNLAFYLDYPVLTAPRVALSTIGHATSERDGGSRGHQPVGATPALEQSRRHDPRRVPLEGMRVGHSLVIQTGLCRTRMNRVSGGTPPGRTRTCQTCAFPSFPRRQLPIRTTRHRPVGSHGDLRVS